MATTTETENSRVNNLIRKRQFDQVGELLSPAQPQSNPIKAFRKLHKAWLTAKHRSDMNKEMDTLAKSLGLNPLNP